MQRLSICDYVVTARMENRPTQCELRIAMQSIQQKMETEMHVGVTFRGFVAGYIGFHCPTQSTNSFPFSTYGNCCFIPLVLLVTVK